MTASKTVATDYCERWVRDGVEVCHVPAWFASVEADMSVCRDIVENSRRLESRVTYTHLLVRAAAIALSRNADLHRMVCGSYSYFPQEVDIALSVAGETAAAPLLVIEGADRKSLPEIAREIRLRTPGIREADRAMNQQIRRWGRLIPVGILRRAFLRLLFRNAAFRRRGAGTFQVSVLSNVDQAGSFVFSASAMLMAGAVRDKVVAVNGRPAVQPMVTLTCCVDHRVWDGRAGERFLASVREILQSDVLRAEFRDQKGKNRQDVEAAAPQCKLDTVSLAKTSNIGC